MTARRHEGDTRIAPNGYHYTYVAGTGWRLTHHIIAEEKYGRKIQPDVTVRFVDGDRTNLSPDNIVLKNKYEGKKGRRTETIKKLIDDHKRAIRELQAELEIESARDA